MRKLTIWLLVLISLLCIKDSYSQFSNWSPLKRLTSGYKDTNPAFAPHSPNTLYIYPWEILVFQREIDTTFQICAMRLNSTGPMESSVYLTSNNFKNRNPCIAYKTFTYTDSVKNALALWETNQNGKWDIYCSYYTPSGWSAPFPFDSTEGNKYNPAAIMFTSTEFGIVYTRDDDIIYRRFNAATKTVLNEMNFTSSVSSVCNSALIAQPFSAPLSVSFRYQKPDNSFGIYKITSSNSGTSWSSMDTVAFSGNNFNTQNCIGNGGTQYIFESNRNGKSGIYSLSSGFAPAIETILSSPYYNYYGLKTWYFPILTDAYVSHISAVIRKSNDSTKIMFNLSSFTSIKDSITLGDTNKKVTVALNNGVRYGQGAYYFYSVFNKDSAGFTSLYYKSKIESTSDINQIGNTIAKDFNLYQNYPNPFNPTTKIKFDIPKSSDVKLIIFDAVGREVKNITQNNLTAGSYEYEFNGENLSSGIYYFKLQTNEFAKTMKMVLVK